MKNTTITTIWPLGYKLDRQSFEDAAYAALNSDPNIQMWPGRKNALDEIEKRGYDDMSWMRSKHNDIICGQLIDMRLIESKEVQDVLESEQILSSDIDFFVKCTIDK